MHTLPRLPFRKTACVRLFYAITILAATLVHSAGQGTAFTYQGQLSSSGAPANGLYEFQFAVYDAATSGTQQASIITLDDVGVTNGLFTTTLDFGNVFSVGARRWLSISVRTNGSARYTLLNPRQEITPSPYAI